MSRTTALLARTFFGRFFESDLMPPGLPQAQLVIGSLVALAAPGLLLPARFAAKYLQISRDPQLLTQALLVDRLLFITLTMTAMGLVALVIWEGVFPDRRDARILAALPLSTRELIAGRLIALAALAGIFVLGVNAVPALMYGPLIAAYGAASNAGLGLVAHFIATASAGAFVFFSLLTAQGLLLNVAGRRIAERLSVILQAVFLVVLLQMIFFLPRMGAFVRTDLAAVAAHPYLGAVPSIWFLGLYDVLGGRQGAGSGPFAVLALLATAAAAVLAAGLMILTHGRLMRRALEGREATGRSGRVIGRVFGRVADIFWHRRSIERAAFAFTLRTLVRSRTHGMLLALYVGVALALVVSGLIPVLLRQGLAGFARPDVPLLSPPFILAFLTLAGMRVVIAIPVEPKANWIVRLLEPGDRGAVSTGVRDAFLVGGALPATAIAGVNALVLWGPWPALVHTVVCAAMAWILSEVLLLTLQKVPFTATYYPGRARLRTRWPLYLIAFTNFCFTTAAFELLMISNPAMLVAFVGASGGAIAVLSAVRQRRAREAPGLTFEEEDPDALFQGFRLSEGLAAQRTK